MILGASKDGSDMTSGKSTQAEKFNVKVLSEQEFWDKYGVQA